MNEEIIFLQIIFYCAVNVKTQKLKTVGDSVTCDDDTAA